MVEAAVLNKNDQVLEIGAGRGVVTRKIAEKAGKVWAVEIDRNFAKELKKMPPNVKVIFADALKILGKVKFDKIVASLPSSIVEPLVKRLIKIDFKLVSLLVPLKFAGKLLNDVFLTTYFETQLISKVERKSFHPQPKTNWALVRITKKPPPLAAKDYPRFIRKYLIEHPKAKLKNALAEVVVEVYLNQGEKLTKNQARTIIQKLKISALRLESPIHFGDGLIKISESLAKVL